VAIARLSSRDRATAGGARPPRAGARPGARTPAERWKAH